MAEYASKGVAGAGLGAGIAGLSLGVLNGVANGNGVLGGLLGGVPAAHCHGGVSQAEMNLAIRNAQLEAGIAQRDAYIYTDQQTDLKVGALRCEVEQLKRELCDQKAFNATVTASQACMAQQIAVLNGITNVLIPQDKIYPAVMPLYNSWVAPTTTATATTTATT